jgi:hypothetical protein
MLAAGLTHSSAQFFHACRQSRSRAALPVLAAARRVPELKPLEEYQRSEFAPPKETGNWPLDALKRQRYLWVGMAASLHAQLPIARASHHTCTCVYELSM